MSKPPFAIRRGVKRRGMGAPAHAHGEAQLTFAARGAVQVHTGEGRWLVPPQLAVWIPAGIAHRIEVLTEAELWIVHWQPSAMRDWAPTTLPRRAFALRATPLLRTLLTSVFGAATGPEKAELVVRLILHELTETVDAATFLPLPASPIGQRVAELASGDPKGQLDVGELASRAATSVRTISRIFRAQTGMTFKAWRQRARIVDAMHRLAGGDAIARVSAESGFSSTAAFSCAFRQVTDMTPTTFVGRSGGPPY